jgi:hypothetical protein
MSIESLQSQIETLRTKTIDLNGQEGQVASDDYHTLIESLVEMTASAINELKKIQAEIEAVHKA